MRLAKLRYCQEFSLNPVAASTDVQVFRANCCYDPDFTGLGHQPIGFDQLMLAYDHFSVLGSSIRVINTSPVTTNVTPAYWGVLLSDNGTSAAAASNIEHLMELPGQLMSQGMAGYVWTRGHKQGNTLTRKFSAKKFFGKKNIIGAADYRGNAGASPNEQAFFEVWAASPHGVDPGLCYFRVVLDLIVAFTEPKGIPQS